ncbi:MAG TPA: RNB domain-containing ribonuclease [Terriglobales bacterium]|nr:RNB domain-containing ribonuclease [Terriglobales bacterium]
MLSDRAILDKIDRQPKKTAGFKQLVRELGIHGDERRELNERLEGLVERGELVEVPGDRYAIPQAAGGNLVLGRLSMHRDGYGFVIPEAADVKRRLSGDIFVPAVAIGTAMHGDRVLVEMGAVRDGRAEGRIVRVAGRAHPTVVGTFHYGTRFNYVMPIDEKITQEIVIPRGMERPKPTAEHAESAEGKRSKSRAAVHRVLGQEARRSTEFEDLENVVVDVEITDWPSPAQNSRGRVVEILGYEDDFGVDVEIIIRKFHLPHRFPVEVLEEAQNIEDIISHGELRWRRDYRGLPIVTIDGETARDFDDAVFVRRLTNGNYELQVHIADVAHYVTDSSALDREARLRGTSVYFPDRAVPMLPVELSTDICSLRPDVDRLVMSCVMEIDHQGEIVRYELHPGAIRSAERMTYTDVNLVLEGDQPLRERYARLADNFKLMRELALILNRKRVRRGSIDFDLPEPVIEFDEEGMMRGVTRSERNIAHRLIEEFMLSANECVASYLEHKGVPSLYRIHEKPDPKKVFEFETIAASFGYSLGVGALPVRRMEMRAERRARHGTGRPAHVIELPEEVHITPRMYQKLTEKIAGKPEERILSYLMLRSLKQARYSEENVGHFALAAPTYTHFTSPIRRYPDLIVHRILKEVLGAETEEHGTVRAGRGVPAHSETPSPWSKRSGKWEVESGRSKGIVSGHDFSRAVKHGKSKGASDLEAQAPISEEALHDIAEESSQSERRADDAERELIEWKKIKFMRERVGDEFDALIVSVTKFGFFVELMDMFIEGLVPIGTLTGDRYTYRENTKQIIGEHTKKKYSLGDRVKVVLDRIDRMQRKLQFAVLEEEPSRAQKRHRHR